MRNYDGTLQIFSRGNVSKLLKKCKQESKIIRKKIVIVITTIRIMKMIYQIAQKVMNYERNLINNQIHITAFCAKNVIVSLLC